LEARARNELVPGKEGWFDTTWAGDEVAVGRNEERTELAGTEAEWAAAR
jgi:hypothetical protein